MCGRRYRATSARPIFLNTRASESAAVLEALQDDALAARHLVDLVEREDEQLAVLADGRDVIAVDRTRRRGPPPAPSRSAPACPCASRR